MDSFDSRVGESIKAARESKGLKQEQLAEICRVLGISMDELARDHNGGSISNQEAFDIVMKKLMMDKLQEALDILGKENETGSERID
ncbi:MAG: helix-turn-helix transcriptional regulator [Firmicutes bacterium]|nr:helix-turn-helix transcriptional regulator [Bacillota bacterium]